MNINTKQVLAITIAVLGVLVASTAQLTDLIGPANTKVVQSIAGLMLTLLSSISAVISSQTGLVKDVQAMPGVEKIVVNAQANQSLAQAAVDPANPKIEATPGAAAQVQQIAKG